MIASACEFTPAGSNRGGLADDDTGQPLHGLGMAAHAILNAGVAGGGPILVLVLDSTRYYRLYPLEGLE
jgi:hypothetical protein